MKLYTISIKLILLAFILFGSSLFAAIEVRHLGDTIHNVTVQISPFDAECTINGEVVEPSKIDKPLERGVNVVKLTKNGYKNIFQ
ncbi:MAG: hypothetical protein IPJ75_13350 [Ignavibacteriales bacterium]|nr:hypothetical protein [Ignavibacteriales bacterium]